MIRNWLKESIGDFTEVHCLTSEDCFEKLRQLYKKRREIHCKVKVFSVKLKEAEKPPGPAI